MKKLGLNGTQLKIIACVAMVIDHATVALGVSGMAYEVLRGIGRLAFPVYALLLVEGAHYTRDWRHYLGRLLFLAAVSEVPFDLVIMRGYRTSNWFAYQNVFWELALMLLVVRGAMALWAWGTSRGVWARVLAVCAIVVMTGVAASAAEAAELDYGMYGIVLAAALWALRGHRIGQAIATFLVLVIELPGIVLGSVAVFAYNGTRGTCRYPWLFYWFYPAHLAVLAGLAYLLA